MTDSDRDPVLDRAIDELRRMPAVDREAVRRVVGAAAAARLTPADEPATTDAWRGSRGARFWSIATVAAAAAIVGFVARGVWAPAGSTRGMPVANVPAAPPAGAPLISAANSGEPMPLLEEFVVVNNAAHRISVVGDFNKWDAHAAPMTRSGTDGLWSAMLPIFPGRHVYGFMIDDSVFVLDPRAPKARDPDLGTDASVRIVGRP